MVNTTERIREHIRLHPNCTELQIARALYGPSAVQQQVNTYLRRLSAAGIVLRDRQSGVYTYTLPDSIIAPNPSSTTPSPVSLIGLSEDEIKVMLRAWLEAQDYNVRVMMGKDRGIDIDARRNNIRWIIEVKGAGSRPQMRVNYFLAMLGEVLQRMDDPTAKYSIALPDMEQFRRLWQRLPTLAKERTQVTALFIDREGNVFTEDY